MHSNCRALMLLIISSIISINGHNLLYVKSINDSNHDDKQRVVPFDYPKEPDEKLPVHFKTAARIAGAVMIVPLLVFVFVFKRRRKRDHGNSRRMLELENHSTTQTDQQVPEDETTFSGNQPGYASRETQISLANTDFNDVPITHGQGCQIIYDADQGIYKIIADGHPLAGSSGYDCNQSLTNGQNENTDTIMHGQALASNDNQNPANDQNSQTIIDADQSKFGHSVDGSHPFASDDHDENLSPANDHSVNIDAHTPNDDQALVSSLGGIHDGGQGNYQTTTSDYSYASDDHHDDQCPANDHSGDISTHTPTYCEDDLHMCTLASNESSSVETHSFASNQSTNVPSQCIVGHQPLPFVIPSTRIDNSVN